MEDKIDDEDAKNNWPSFRSCLLAVVGFIIFALVGILAIRFPTNGARIVVPIFVFIVDVCIIVKTGRDILKKESVRRNVANTVLLIFLTVVLMTFLYEFVWYDQMNTSIVKFSIERPGIQRLPGVVVLEQSNFPGHAILTTQAPPRCILGGYVPGDTPLCSSLSKEQVLNISTCDCSSGWDPEIRQNFGGVPGYMSLTFTPAQNLVTEKPLVYMNLVVSFQSNLTNNTGGPSIFNPSLFILIFDPTNSPETVYRQAGSDFALISANSQLSIDLSPRVLKNEARWSQSSVNDSMNYNSAITSIPHANQPCNLANNDTGVCEAHISLRFSTFDVDTTSIEDEKSFGNIIESVGAFYALAQLVTWIFSGLAWVN